MRNINSVACVLIVVGMILAMFLTPTYGAVIEEQSKGLSDFEQFKQQQLVEFEQLKQQQMEQYTFAKNKQLAEFELFKENQQMDLEQFIYQIRLEKLRFSQKVAEHWPVVETTNHNKLVLYGDGVAQKLVVDYHTKQIRYSSLDGQDKNRQLMQSDIINLLQQPLNQQPLHFFADQQSIAKLIGLTNQQDINAFAARLLTDTNLKTGNAIDEQIATDNQIESQLIDSQIKANAIPQRIPASGEAKSEVAKSDVGRFNQDFSQNFHTLVTDNSSKSHSSKQITTYGFSFNSKPLSGKYDKEINKWSKQFSLSKSWILALIDASSNFFEQGISPGPAYGLMQISVGMVESVIQHKVQGFTKPPTINQLYKPDTNIGYGSAYLHVLMSITYKDINDKKSQLYCAIVAYNLGIAGVNQIFSGNGTMLTSTAVTNINQLTATEVLKKLLQGMPQSVDRQFINSVLAAIKKY